MLVVVVMIVAIVVMVTRLQHRGHRGPCRQCVGCCSTVASGWLWPVLQHGRHENTCVIIAGYEISDGHDTRHGWGHCSAPQCHSVSNINGHTQFNDLNMWPHSFAFFQHVSPIHSQDQSWNMNLMFYTSIISHTGKDLISISSVFRKTRILPTITTIFLAFSQG